MRIATTLLTLALSVTACKKKESEQPAPPPPPTETGSGSASAAPPPAIDAAVATQPTVPTNGSGSDTGSGSAIATQPMTHKTGMCPSTVFGATSVAKLEKGAVVLTITSDDKDAVLAIQRRTDESIKDKEEKNASGTSSGHDAKGMHGGGIGLCPLHIPEGAKAESKPDPKGVRITITPKDPKDADGLKTDIDGRIAKAADWVKQNVKPGDQQNQGGDGGGSGEHGSNHSGKGDGKGGGHGDGTGGGKGGHT